VEEYESLEGLAGVFEAVANIIDGGGRIMEFLADEECVMTVLDDVGVDSVVP